MEADPVARVHDHDVVADDEDRGISPMRAVTPVMPTCPRAPRSRGPFVLPGALDGLTWRREILAIATAVAAQAPGGLAALTATPPPTCRRDGTLVGGTLALIERLLDALERHDLLPILDADDRALYDDTGDDPDALPFWALHIPLRVGDDVYHYGWTDPPSAGEALLYLFFAHDDDEDADDQAVTATSDLDAFLARLPAGPGRTVVAAAYAIGRRSREGAVTWASLQRVLTDPDGVFAAAGPPFAAVPALASYIAGETGTVFLDVCPTMADCNGLSTMPWTADVLTRLCDDWRRASAVLERSAVAIDGLRGAPVVVRLAELLVAVVGPMPDGGGAC